MVSEIEKVFGDIKVHMQMFTTNRGVGCSIEYVHHCFSSTDGKFWQLAPRDSVTPEQLYEAQRELWLTLEPTVTFL